MIRQYQTDNLIVIIEMAETGKDERHKSMRKRFQDLMIDQKLAVAFIIPMCLMLALSLLFTEAALIQYDKKIYSYESDRLNSVIDSIDEQIAQIDSISYSVAMDASLQSQLYQLSTASNTAYRYGTVGLYGQLVTGFSQNPLTENFIFKDSRITDFRNGALALSLSDQIAEEMVSKAASEFGGLYVQMPEDDIPYLISARQIRHYLNADLKNLGTFIFITRMEDIAGPHKRKDGSSLFIFNNEGKLIYGNEELSKEVRSHIMEDGYSIENLNGRKYFISCAQGNSFCCISIFPYSQLFSLTTVIRALLIISFILLYGIVFIAIRRITRSITEPVRSLSASMLMASEGSMDDAITILGDSFSNDEMGHLANEYKSMIIRIRTLIKENYEKQILLKDTRYRMLKAQINPHFLYNTLNSIGWAIKLEKNEEAAGMLKALGNLLHRAFDRNMLTTLGEEASLMEDYVYIQKVRYAERMSFSMSIPEEIRSIKIPPLLIQPLVENCLQHGTDVSGDHINIEVKAVSENGYLAISVKDDGPGFSANRLEEVRSMTYKSQDRGIGLKNISSRLHLIYGENAGLSIRSRKGETIIKLRIPEKI